VHRSIASWIGWEDVIGPEGTVTWRTLVWICWTSEQQTGWRLEVACTAFDHQNCQTSAFDAWPRYGNWHRPN